jgi:2-(1,2-epoxy-1,2-dihydrophenyl)acetyl-CoA isomerase
MAEALIASGLVLLDLEVGGLAHLRLNRPEASNAMDLALLRALHEALIRCQRESRLRALLVTGEGRNFCAGGDVHAFASQQGERLPEYVREATAWLQIAASALMRLPAPVIAAVQGFAAGGGGFGLVCASDLVLAAESAKFLLGATRVGMAPDAGGSVTLARIVGLRRAMEIALTNPTIGAAEALEIGLVNRVVPDDVLLDEALALGRALAAAPTAALAATKRLIWDGLGAVVEARLPEEARTVTELSGTADAREGLAAVIEKRVPRFVGR